MLVRTIAEPLTGVRGAQAEKSYHWDAEADSGHFVVAYPDGLNRAWNTGGGCCGVPGRTNADDVGFITAMVSAIQHEVPVNPRNSPVRPVPVGLLSAVATQGLVRVARYKVIQWPP